VSGLVDDFETAIRHGGSKPSGVIKRLKHILATPDDQCWDLQMFDGVDVG